MKAFIFPAYGQNKNNTTPNYCSEFNTQFVQKSNSLEYTTFEYT